MVCSVWQDVLHDPQEVVTNEGGSRFSKWFAMATSDANINNNLMFNHRRSPAHMSEDFNYLCG
jgi:hypothetical protein